MADTLSPRSARSVEIKTLDVPAGKLVPNNPDFPAVLAQNALGGVHDDADVKALLAKNGWGGTWTWRVFDYHHFHPDAFEALAVASGSASLMLGGPQGEEIEVRTGDVMILPPGFGHKQISADADFQICGAYPPGQEDYTVVRAEHAFDDAVLRRIATVKRPETDPVWDGNGPLLAKLTGAM